MSSKAVLKISIPLEAPPQAASDDHLVELWVYRRSPQTTRAYRADAARFMDWVQKPLRAVSLPDLVNFSKTLDGLATASQLRTLSSIKSLFAFGHRIGYLPFDIGRALKLPVARDQLAQRILPEAEVHRMLSLEEDPRNRAILTLLYASGIRVGELCGLKWQDLSANSDGGQITVLGKGTKTRSIRLPAAVWKMLMALRRSREAGDPVFISRKKKPLSPSQVWRIVRAAARRAGIEANVSPH